MKKEHDKKIKPGRDWKIIVSLFGVGLVALSVFAWSIYLSDQIGGGYLSPESTAVDVGTRTIDLKKLQSTTSMIEGRQPSTTKVIDPSL